MSETRHDKFVRLVQKRVPKAMEAIRLVTQLSSANYEYTADEASEVHSVLKECIDNLANEFGLTPSPAATPVVAESPVQTVAPVEQRYSENHPQTVDDVLEDLAD